MKRSDPTAPAPTAAAHAPAAWGERLAVWLLGADRRQRVRASQSLVVVCFVALYALIQHAEVLLGLVDPAEARALTAVSLVVSTGFFLVIRSGFNLRLGADPSLTMPQMLSAISLVSWMYGITGVARGAILAIMIMVVLFGVFSLRPRQARLLALLALLQLGGWMAWRSLGPQPRHAVADELVHFAFAAIVMLGTSVVTVRLGRLRARLSEQKAELTRALALNRELATRDMLTGLLNRRAMVELLAQAVPWQRRADGPAALALLDLDHFKRINDTLGHQVGDAVLQRFAERAKTALRAGDALARWGGEEFLLLMPGTSVAESRLLLQRLRQQLGSGAFADLAPGLSVSFSAGVAACGSEGDGVAAIEQADAALYRAKRAGRDRVEFDDGSLPPLVGGSTVGGSVTAVPAAGPATAAAPVRTANPALAGRGPDPVAA